MDRRDLLAAAGLAGPLLPLAAKAATAPRAGPAKPDASFPIWPNDPFGLKNPDLADHVLVRSQDPAFPDRAMDHIRTPRLDVFRAKKPNGAAMLVIPGGGYARVVVDKEGYELGSWFAARGITAFVLFYRLPGDGWDRGSNAPFADAQRAMRVIRARAAQWQVDPARIGAMGFSAGGHLCADLATRLDTAVGPMVDAIDAFDPRPIVAAPIYPVMTMAPPYAHAGSRTQLIGKSPDTSVIEAHSPEKRVDPKKTPPCFLVHAQDDDVVPVENSLLFRDALRKAGIASELHLFERGGHGFGWGARTEGKPAHLWPELFLAWAKGHGLLG